MIHYQLVQQFNLHKQRTEVGLEVGTAVGFCWSLDRGKDGTRGDEWVSHDKFK